MAKIIINLDEESGMLDLTTEGFNFFETIGILSVSQSQLIAESQMDGFADEEIVSKQIKTKGNA